jgi:hypothetical protein
LIADACNNRSIAFALVAHLVPSRVVQERRPPRLEIGQRLPLKNVSQLVVGFPDKGCPKADRTDTVLFPDGRKLVSKSGLQLCHLARNSLLNTQLVNHRGNPLCRTYSRLLQQAGIDRHLVQALAGGGKDGVSDLRHDADFHFDLQIELMNSVCPSEAI